MKDAGVNADFPETFEMDIPFSLFTNNLVVSAFFLFTSMDYLIFTSY